MLGSLVPVTRARRSFSSDRVRNGTGWPVRFADDVTETPPATPAELATLRDLHARTSRAHGAALGNL